VHKDPLTAPEPSPPQAREGQDRAVADRRPLLEGVAARQLRDRRSLAHADELRVRAETIRVDAEHALAGRELHHRRAHRFDLTGELATENRPARTPQAAEAANEHRAGITKTAVRPVHGRRADANEHLVIARPRHVNLHQSQDLR